VLADPPVPAAVPSRYTSGTVMMPDPPTNLIARKQAEYNRSTRAHWDHFARHRGRVAELLVPDQLATGGRLCVLGAGNCNDLDLPRLLETFDQIDLVDLDADAIRAAVERQGMGGEPRVRLHGGLDLTAAAPILADWPRCRPTDRQVDDCVRAITATPQPAIGGPFDVILSPCVLSQICLSANDALAPRHPRRRDLRDAIRRRHVRQIVEWLAPGGSGLLVIDLVQADRLGALVHTHRDRLGEVAARTIAKADHFPGLDPDSLRAALLDDPLVSGMVSGVQEIAPWLWTLGPHKAFLVYALRFRRSHAQVLGRVEPG
jgi:hypothetical protein